MSHPFDLSEGVHVSPLKKGFKSLKELSNHYVSQKKLMRNYKDYRLNLLEDEVFLD
jgi:hypothetical protein